MNENYKKMINAFPVGEIINGRPIYNYDKAVGLEKVYDKFYEHFIDHLQYKSQLLGFPPSYLYFVDHDGKNAIAHSEPKYKAIGIFRGLVEKMYAFFKDQDSLLQSAKYQNIKLILQTTGENPYEAFMQYFLMFSYYHEYAHLVQTSPVGVVNYNEDDTVAIPPADVPLSHTYEMDADWLATNYVGWQITHHFKDENGNWLSGSSEQIEDLMIIALCSIFCFFIQSANRYPNIYFDEKLHPHPLIRITFIAQYLHEVVGTNIPKGIKIDYRSTLYRALQLAEEMLLPTYGNAVEKLADLFENNYDAIEIYGNKIIALAISKPGMCRNRPPVEL